MSALSLFIFVAIYISRDYKLQIKCREMKVMYMYIYFERL